MDGTIRGLTVIINGDATKLSKAMRDARAEAGMLRGQLASVGKLMEFNPGSTELVRQKQRLLGEAIAANSRAYTRYQQAHAAYSGRLSSLTEAEMAQFRKLESEMLRNRVEFQNLTRQATAFGAAAPAGMIAAGNSARSMSEGMRTFSNYALGASAATALVGAYAVKAAKDYEYAFADVRKTIVATEAEYAALSDAVIEMSLVRPASAQDIAYIMSLGGQLNIATQHLEKFAGTIADLDVATNMDLEAAALDVARFMNITGTAQGNVDRLGATIVDLGNNSATTEADIMAMAMRIAGTGSSLGMTAAEVLGLATSLSSVGIQAEMGGNAISTIMRRIDRDVQTNSSTLDTWAATAGMSAQQFKSLWTSDVTQGLIAVIKGMGQFQDEGGSLTLLLDELDISYMRQVDTMMRMAQAGEMANSLITRSNNAFAENSALAREVSQRYETNEAKLQMMANAAQAAAIAFGNELLPSFRDVVVGATDFLQAVASLDSGTKDTIVTVGAAVIGFGLFTKAVQTGGWRRRVLDQRHRQCRYGRERVVAEDRRRSGRRDGAGRGPGGGYGRSGRVYRVEVRGRGLGDGADGSQGRAHRRHRREHRRDGGQRGRHGRPGCRPGRRHGLLDGAHRRPRAPRRSAVRHPGRRARARRRGGRAARGRHRRDGHRHGQRRRGEPRVHRLLQRA